MMSLNLSSSDSDQPAYPFPGSQPRERSAAATRLAAAGVALFGHRFHTALADELGVSRPLVVAMINDQRRVTPEIERRLAVAIRSRIVPRLEDKIRALAEVAETIERKLGAYSPERTAGDVAL